MSDTPYNHPAIDAILDAIEGWETADLDSDAPIHGAVGFINRLAERGFSIEGEDIEADEPAPKPKPVNPHYERIPKKYRGSVVVIMDLPAAAGWPGTLGRSRKVQYMEVDTRRGEITVDMDYPEPDPYYAFNRSTPLPASTSMYWTFRQPRNITWFAEPHPMVAKAGKAGKLLRRARKAARTGE